MKNEKQKTKWYKVLSADLHSFNGGEFDYTPYIGTGISLPVIADLVLCRRGYHFTTDPMQWPAVGMRVFEVIVAKCDGPAEWQDDKGVFRSGRLGDERPDIIPEWWRELEAFVRSIKEAKIKPQAAADDAADDAACDAARDAAWYAAWYAERDAVWYAAWYAARDAVWCVAGDAVWCVAGDAASLLATCIVARDLIDPVHYDFAKKNWESCIRKEP